MDNRVNPDYLAAMERIQVVTGCSTQQEIANFLGLRQSSIADAKKRGRIPSDWLLTLWRKKGVNPDWILTGQGSRRLKPADCSEAMTPTTIYVKEIRPPEECSIEELMMEIIRRATSNRSEAKRKTYCRRKRPRIPGKTSR